VSGRALLLIVASLQSVFLVLLLILLLVRRALNRRYEGAIDLARSGLPGPLRAWLVDGGEP